MDEILTTREVIVATAIGLLVPIAFNLTKIAIPMKIISVGISKGVVILPLLVGNIFQVVTRPIFGVFAEKYGHKKIFGSAPILYAISFMIFANSKGPLDVYIASIILSLGIAAFWSAFLAYSSYLKYGAAKSIAHVLAFSFVGAFIGTAYSGYVFDAFGYDVVFMISALICILAVTTSLFTHSPKGNKELSLGDVYAVAISNIKDTILNANTLSLIPIVNTYAPILLIDAGLSPTITGLVLVALPLMSAIMQYFGGKAYNKIVSLRPLINILSLLILISFAYLSVIRAIYLAVLSFVLYSIFASTMFTPQITRSIDTSEDMRAVGTGGFGSGMTLARVIASSVAVVGGNIAETGTINLNPPFFALTLTTISFVGISLFGILKNRKK